MTLLLLILGIVLLLAGAELLVRGASRLAVAAGIPSLVIGLTVVAFGTSAPELAVSLGATLGGQPDIALGNVVGSNIFNVLFILGMSALVAPLVVARQVVRSEVPFMVAVSILLLLLSLDGAISRIEGVGLFATVVGYTAVLIRNGRRSTAALASSADLTTIALEVGATGPGWRQRLLDIVMIAIGLMLLVLGAGWLVDAAREIASALGLSELVIGLTIVAAGTSLPELATSVVATIRGERDIAVGNVVGSSIFNILCILGLTAVVGGEVPVSEAARTFDVPVMTAVAVACLPIFFTGHLISRWEGALFVAYYVAYTAYLVLDATGHTAVPAFGVAILWFALPLTLVTLGILIYREWRVRRVES